MTVDRRYATTDYKGEELSEEQLQWLRENRVDIEPFTSLNWKTAESRDQWQDIHRRIEEAQHEAEWRSVLSDKTERSAAIIHVTNTNREKWLKRVGEHGLAYKDIRYTAPYQGFAHEHKQTTEDDPNRITYAVIAENEDITDVVEEAELEKQGEEYHETMGQFLNFPECCREFFIENWGTGEGEWADPMYEISCNTPSAERVENDDEEHIVVTDPNEWTNAMYRYFGLRFITHLPCSWECERSAEIAKKRGQIMADNGYKDAANSLYKWLYEPMLWESAKGIANIRNQHITASANSSSYWETKKVTWKEPHQPGGSILRE